MKMWKKITIAVATLLIAGLVFLYFYGYQTSDPDDGDQRDSPIFPFETPDDDDFFGDGGDDTDDGTDTDPDSTADIPPKLWQISDRPVAGSQWVTPGSGPEEIWHVRKENGHVYSSSPADREPERLTNTTIPRVQEALISPRGDYVIYRYVSDDDNQIKTYIAELTESNNGEIPYQTNGNFMPDNIISINLSPNGGEIFYLLPDSSGVVGVIYNVVEDDTRVVFESPIKEWRSQWVATNEVVLFNKPAVGSEGFAYSVNTNTGERSKLTEGRGLIASMSPNGEYVLTSHREGGSYQGRIVDRDDPGTTLLSPRTIADKCGWSQSTNDLFCGIINDLSINNLLRDWYQGKISFDNRLIRFDIEERDQIDLLTDNQREQGPFDITDIQIDVMSEFLVFTNKRTGMLWGLDFSDI